MTIEQVGRRGRTSLGVGKMALKDGPGQSHMQGRITPLGGGGRRGASENHTEAHASVIATVKKEVDRFLSPFSIKEIQISFSLFHKHINGL
jgi:hypothetical protein